MVIKTFFDEELETVFNSGAYAVVKVGNFFDVYEETKEGWMLYAEACKDYNTALTTVVMLESCRFTKAEIKRNIKDLENGSASRFFAWDVESFKEWGPDFDIDVVLDGHVADFEPVKMHNGKIYILEYCG